MMTLSMVGIIWVQTIFIRDAVAIHNESFDNVVVACLNNAADLITSSQRMNYFNNYLPAELSSRIGYSAESTSFRSVQIYSSLDSNGLRVSFENQLYSGFPDDNEYRYNYRGSYVFTGDKDAATDSAILSIASRNEINRGGIEIRGNERSRPLSARQHDFLNWIKGNEGEFHNLSDQHIMEIYEWEKTVDINNENVDNALKQTFAYAGIETPYEFAIIKNGQVQDRKNDKIDFLNTPSYMVRLFPANIIRQDIILSVIFPARAKYVLQQVLWLLGGSLAFSLFIVATFGLSLFFIIRQKKISEMKSDFLNNMTHEFKTPIATISLAADTISNPKVINDESKVLQFISMIKKENSRMNKKVETILQIASLDKKEIQFNFENVSMHNIIDYVLETMEIQVQRKNGRIIKSYCAANHFVNGDSEHLSNLVNNLLDNAVKYSPANPEITITTKNVDKGFVFAVADNGIGMTKAVQSKIFERFYRQPSGNIHNVKGFGLGLHYVRTIVEAHKGTINVTSESGKGSCFEIFLPTNTEN
jgi:two-component system phosphate regulon sensor histidine kinase PhoR